MEKIVITEEEKVALADYVLSQEKMKLNVIDHFIENKKRDNRPFVSLYKPLNRFTPEQFALLLCDWYEIEQPFKVGDWVKWTHKKETEYLKIKGKEHNSFIFSDDSTSSISNSLIYIEKVTEPWKIMLLELGRDKPEFKIGDKYEAHLPRTIKIDEHKKSAEAQALEGNIKYFYPVESRIEVKAYDNNRE